MNGTLSLIDLRTGEATIIDVVALRAQGGEADVQRGPDAHRVTLRYAERVVTLAAPVPLPPPSAVAFNWAGLDGDVVCDPVQLAELTTLLALVHSAAQARMLLLTRGAAPLVPVRTVGVMPGEDDLANGREAYAAFARERAAGSLT